MNNKVERIFDHVLIITLENEYRSYVMKNAYMRNLAAQGLDLACHFGVMHPSQTNYVASIAGELCNISYDWPPYPSALPQRTIVDLIEQSPLGLRWKAYLQTNVRMLWKPDLQPSDFSLPFPVPTELWKTLPPPFKDVPQPLYPYAYFHNPFSIFERILRNPTRWKKLEDESAFWRDLLTGDFPEFAWFTPNLWDDGHYLYGTAEEPADRAPLVDQQATWLQSFFASLRFPGPRSLLPPRTLVVVTYDESDFDDDYDENDPSTYDGPNQIYTVLLGDMIKPGVNEEASNHYTLLKTIERNFDLPSLGKNDDDSNWLQVLWGKRFDWRAPVETPIAAHGTFAAAALNDLLYVIYVTAAGQLAYRVFDWSRWSDERSVSSQPATSIAATPCGEQLLLVFRHGSGGLSLLTFSPGVGWSSAPVALVTGSFAAFSIASIGSDAAMLAYADTDGNLFSMRYGRGVWGAPVAVGHKTGGDVVLAVLGPSIFLICKAVHSNQMNVVSYNTADFNVIAPPPEVGGRADDTTKGKWSPSAFPVAHYGRTKGAQTQGQPEPVRQPYLAGSPLAAACLDGVIHLAYPGPDDSQVQTATFAQSGILTPAKPVERGSTARVLALSGPQRRPAFSIWSRFLSPVETVSFTDRTTSNGFGTLAEAGWSRQTAIGGVHSGAPTLVMTRFGARLALLFQPGERARLQIALGEYRDIGS